MKFNKKRTQKPITAIVELCGLRDKLTFAISFLELGKAVAGDQLFVEALEKLLPTRYPKYHYFRCQQCCLSFHVGKHRKELSFGLYVAGYVYFFILSYFVLHSPVVFFFFDRLHQSRCDAFAQIMICQ